MAQIFKNSISRIIFNKDYPIIIDDLLPLQQPSMLLARSLDANQLLEVPPFSDLSIFYKMIKFGCAEPIWIAMKAILPKEAPKELLEERLDILLQKNENNLNMIDYSVMRKKGVLAEYVKGFSKKLRGEELQFPSILQIEVGKHIKSKEELTHEKKMFKEVEQKMEYFDGNGKFGAKFTKSVAGSIEKYGSLDFYTHVYNKDVKQKIADLQSQISKKFPESENSYFACFELDFEYSFVDTPEQLEMCSRELKDYNLICFDIEMAYMKFNDQFEEENGGIAASIQLSTVDKAYFIDILALHKEIKENLRWLFEDPKIVKVFHGCEGDIKWLYQAFGFVTRNIFDTTKAEKILRKTKSTVGLRELAKRVVGVKMDKSFQFSTWSIRPLPRAMVEYAIADAVLLLPIYAYYCELLQKEKQEKKNEIIEGLLWGKCNLVGKWAKELDYHYSMQILESEY